SGRGADRRPRPTPAALRDGHAPPRGRPPPGAPREIRRNCRARRYPREAPQEPRSRRPAAALRRYRKGGRRRKSRIVIARSEATKQSMGLGGRTGLLRFARNDGALDKLWWRISPSSTRDAVRQSWSPRTWPIESPSFPITQLSR